MRHLSCAGEVWLDLLDSIINNGQVIGPRGMKTTELLCSTSIVDMNFPIVDIKERKVSYSFMFAEAWWILSGKDDVASLKKYAPSISQYSDNGINFSGAYGPRVVEQIQYVLETLCKDICSRQAIIEIWRPYPGPSKDIPCTLSLQFLIRNGKINCIATMRSSDAWIGFIYDVFVFSCIASYVMMLINSSYGAHFKLGYLYLTAGSQHLYDKNYSNAFKILEKELDNTCGISPPLYDGKEFDFKAMIETCKKPNDLITKLEHLKEYFYETK